MSQNTCIQTAKFVIGGETLFPGTTFRFDIQFVGSDFTAADVLACEWFLDGVLVDGIDTLQFGGQAYCGDHVVAARILTTLGWSGIKTMAFANCKSIVASQTDWPTTIKEGTALPFRVFRTFADGTRFDISASCTFAVSEGGHFEQNIFYADYSPSLAPVKLVEVTARTAEGEILGPLQLSITNIDKPTIPLSAFDYLVVRYSWQNGASLGLDVAAGFENTDSDFNSLYVGYGQSGNAIPLAQGLQDAYLSWSGDSIKASGEESILINLKKFRQDFTASNVQGDFSYLDFTGKDFLVNDINNLGDVGIYAIWRGKLEQQGLFNVQFSTYSGGIMELNGSTFVNQGGIRRYNEQYLFSTKQTNSNQIDTYYRLAKLRFDKATKRSTMELYDGTAN